MRAVVQRVSEASVRVDGELVASIGSGLLVLVGVFVDDTPADANALVEKIANLRIFGDGHGRMNRSVVDVGGSAIVVSQFTLAADVRRGRRPSFTGAADPAVAEPLIAGFADELARSGVPTETGVFGAIMEVALVNSGPVTIVLDAREGAIR